MSHNKVTVAGQKPDANGSITVPFVSTDQITGTPATNDYLKWNGTYWEPTANASLTTGVGHIFIGQGESDNYSNSPHGTGSFSANNQIYFYDSSPVNTITGATITSSSGWISSITLPAGDYLIHAKTLFEFSADGYCLYALYDGSTRLTPGGVVGELRSPYNGGSDIAMGIIQLASSTTITIKIQALSNVDNGTAQGTTPSKHNLISIEKLS